MRPTILAALVLAATAATAQTPGPFAIRSINSQPGGAFGTTVAAVGDLNGDGVSDLIVGAYGEWWYNSQSGRAYVYDGASGQLLYALRSPSPRSGGAFGIAVAGLGDLDGDGRPEIAVGAPEENGGRVYVFSGATGMRLRTLIGGSGSVAFGYAIADAGDADGDGIPDILVGDYKHTVSFSSAGRAYVLSGQSGAVLYTLSPTAPESELAFGRAVAAGRDVTGDGIPDWVVAARAATTTAGRSGRVYVFDGQDGTLADSLDSPLPSAGGQFGLSVALCADVDGGGTADILVGAGRETNATSEDGRAHLFSGESGALLYTLVSPSPATGGWFGQNVACLADADGDDVPDIAVGAPGENLGAASAGTVYVYSGASGTAIAQVVSPNPEAVGRLGIFVAPVTDISTGALRAIAAGANQEDAPEVNAGVVYVQPIVIGSVNAQPEPARPETRLGIPVPNPTTGRVTFSLSLSDLTSVDVQLVDMQGRVVTQSVFGNLPAGTHSLVFPATGLAPGTYVARVRLGDRYESRPFVVVR